MPGVCAHCLEKLLQKCVGQKVTVEAESQVFIGKLVGVRVIGRKLTVVIQEGKNFRAIHSVKRLTFRKGEVALI
jgi:predicted thioesterase